MTGARHIEVGNVCWISWQAPIDNEYQEEGMTLVIKAQEISFCSIDNICSTPINAKAQVVLELVNPITLWTRWKHRCRQVFSNRTVNQATLLQEIWYDLTVLNGSMVICMSHIILQFHVHF